MLRFKLTRDSKFAPWNVSYQITAIQMEFTYSIIKSQMKIITAFIVDVTRASDIVDHDILLDTLDIYGVGDPVSESYHFNRDHYVVIDKIPSTNIRCDVLFLREWYLVPYFVVNI